VAKTASGSIAALLQRTHADAVGLVEANSLVNIETLGRELSMDVMYGKADSPACVASLSRLPIRSSTNHRLPELAKTPLEVEVLCDDGPLRLYATHLADRFEEVTRPRQAEVQAILCVLRAFRAEPRLLVGDFNALVAGDPVGEPPPGVRETGDAIPDAPARHGLLTEEELVESASFSAKSIAANSPGAPRTIFRWLCVSRDSRKLEAGHKVERRFARL